MITLYFSSCAMIICGILLAYSAMLFLLIVNEPPDQVAALPFFIGLISLIVIFALAFYRAGVNDTEKGLKSKHAEIVQDGCG
jgi:hypothetical protein